MRHTWTEGKREFRLEGSTLYEEGEPGNSAPQEGSIPGFLAREIFRLVFELRVERAHREAAVRQRDDKTEEIKYLREERERNMRRIQELEFSLQKGELNG